MIQQKAGSKADTARAEILPGGPQDRPGTVCLRLTGDWLKTGGRPAPADILDSLGTAANPLRWTFDTSALGRWDSTLVTFLRKLQEAEPGTALDPQGLPEGVQRLLALATAVPARRATDDQEASPPVLARIGNRSLDLLDSGVDVLEFLGDVAQQGLRLLSGRVRFPRRDFLILLEQCGPQAVPIVALISFLVGLILAFIGAVQLATFGAQIYVADLVGIAITRVLGAVMVGIIMTGRTGAAYAAQLGTMQVNEEIDALRTLAISPTEFLVLPRMLALTLMMPLLCLYADLMGILGGLVVGVALLNLNAAEYLHQTTQAVDLTQIGIGLFHGLVFGVLVSFAGCLRGIQCGRSSAAVGAAATSAVVTGIVSITIATAIITTLCNVLGL